MGKVLMQEEPFAHVVDDNLIADVCSNCMYKKDGENSRVLKRCSTCNFVYYCDKKCQKEDWINHKHECLALVRVIPGTVPRFIGRIIARMRSTNATSCAFNGRTFNSLKSRVEEMKNDAEIASAFEAISYALKMYLGEDKMPPNGDLFDIFSKVFLNTCSICDDALFKIGVGLYIGLSELNHSCKPDAYVIFDGRKAVLQSASNEVDKYNSNLHLSYCELINLRSTRRKELKRRYYFDCNCELCTDDQLVRKECSLRCNSCEKGYCPFLLDGEDQSSNVVCDLCGNESLIVVSDARDLLEEISKEMKVEDIAIHAIESRMNTLRDLYKRAEKVFSIFNIPMCQLADRIADLAMSIEENIIARDFTEKTIPCKEMFYQNGHTIWRKMITRPTHKLVHLSKKLSTVKLC